MIGILLQTTANVSISANWVIAIFTSVCGVLALMILNDIRSSIKMLVTRQNEQEKELTKTSARTDYAHDRIDSILSSIK